MTTFEEQRDMNETNIILGLDPKNDQQLNFLLNYFNDENFLNEVKKNIIGIKPNLKFYSNNHNELREILEKFSDKYNILDLKCSDGFNTEKNTIDNWKNISGVSAMTIAPASGDELSFMKYLTNNRIDTYMMGVMSFPGVISKMILGYAKPEFNSIKKAFENGLQGIVMGATANNGDIESQNEKIHQELDENNLEYEVIGTHNDIMLKEGITERNKQFERVYELIEKFNSNVLTPGFGRQGGNAKQYFLNKVYVDNHLINAGSDIIKPKKDEKIITSKENIIENLEIMKKQFQQYKK